MRMDFLNENQNNSGSNQIPLIQDLKNYLRGLFWWPDDEVKVESDEILLYSGVEIFLPINFSYYILKF